MRKEPTMQRISPRRIGVRALGLGLVMALIGGTAGTVGASASTLGGTATIANPSNSQPLASGGSTTLFTVTLPANAACDGDTATGNYEVYSYLVPQGTTITSLTFVGGAPSQGYGLFDTAGDYYGGNNDGNTAITTGQIINIPNNLEWAPLVTTDGGSLTVAQLAGVWEAGIACANKSGTLTDYWNTQVTFSANGSDPNGFTWAAVPGVPPLTPEASWAVVLPVTGVAILGVGLWANRRRSARRVEDSLPASTAT